MTKSRDRSNRAGSPLDLPRPACGERPAPRTFRASIALVAIGLALPLPSWGSCQVETLELPVKMVGSRAVATVGINGTSVPLTVDSGAFFSFLTEAAADQLKLPTKRNNGLRIEGITGRVDARVTTVDKLRLFKGEVEHVDFVVGGNEPGAGTMGLMGRNILSFTDTEYDLAHGVIRFLYPNDDCAKANMAYWAGSTPVTEVELISEYRARAPAIRTSIKLNGTEFTALLDTGATTVVSAAAARRADVAESGWIRAGSVTGAGRGRSDAWVAPFEKFEIGGEAILHNRLPIADFDLGREADVLLGIDFFLSHRIYVSNRQSKMYLTYNGGPVFALDRRDATKAAAPADPAVKDGEATAVSADELARRGAASAARGDYVAALADLDRACELEPTSAALFAQRGALQQAARRPAKALEDFERALALDPSQADARLGRVTSRLAAKDRDGAKADLDALDRTIAPQAQMRLVLAQLYLNIDQPAAAIAQLDRWLPAHSREVDRGVAQDARCRARLMLGVDLERALDDCDDAVGTDAKNASYVDHRGWAYLRLGRYRQAQADFDRSIEVRPTNASSLYGRGLAKSRLGDAAQGDADLAAARKVQADIEARLKRMGLLAGAGSNP